MKLTTREDIEAPPAFVYATLSDFDHWERAGMRRGADVQRSDTGAAPGQGSRWAIGFDYRGKRRKLDIRLVTLDPGNKLDFVGEAPSVEGSMTFDIVEMGPKRTRLAVALDVKPRTLTARLFLQSLRLARARVQRRFDTRVARLAADIEDRYRRSL